MDRERQQEIQTCVTSLRGNERIDWEQFVVELVAHVQVLEQTLASGIYEREADREFAVLEAVEPLQQRIAELEADAP